MKTLAFTALALLTACGVRTPSSYDIPAASPHNNNNTNVEVWVDPVTGCQYLIEGRNTHRGGITARMHTNGTQMCDEREVEQP